MFNLSSVIEARCDGTESLFLFGSVLTVNFCDAKLGSIGDSAPFTSVKRIRVRPIGFHLLTFFNLVFLFPAVGVDQKGQRFSILMQFLLLTNPDDLNHPKHLHN